jgi:hypothetical protein
MKTPARSPHTQPVRHIRLRLPGVGRSCISYRPPQRVAGSKQPTPPWIVFSPGALTTPGDYRVLLGELTAAGAAVLTLDYRWPLLFAGDAAEARRAILAARRLLRGQLPARGLARHRLPPAPTGRRRAAAPLRILGYSLGGWVLSAGFGQGFGGRPVEWVLLGVSSLQEPWHKPATRRARVRLLAGSEDGVVNPAGLEGLAAALGSPVEWLPGVNHFGLLAARVGAPEFRARDRATRLDQRACAARIARQILGKAR